VHHCKKTHDPACAEIEIRCAHMSATEAMCAEGHVQTSSNVPLLVSKHALGVLRPVAEWYHCQEYITFVEPLLNVLSSLISYLHDLSPSDDTAVNNNRKGVSFRFWKPVPTTSKNNSVFAYLFTIHLYIHSFIHLLIYLFICSLFYGIFSVTNTI
jgi:hypothetical protein